MFDVLGYRFHRDGKGFQGTERLMCKVMGGCGGTGTSIVQRVYPCKQNVGESSVTSTARCPKRQAVEWCHAGPGARMGSQIPTSYLSFSEVHTRKLGEFQEKDCPLIAHQMEEDAFADVGRKKCGQNLDDYELGHLRW